MKALIYARQSSGKDDVSESVEAQINNCKRLAEKEKLEVVGVFKDLNTSGETYPVGAESIAQVDSAYKNWVLAQSTKKTFRSGLGEALTLLPDVDFVLVNELTRLYRPINGSFLEGHINQQLKENHVQVLQVQGGSIDLTKFDQQLITMIKNQILYEDLQKKRTNSIIAFRNKRDSGKLCTGTHAYGIRYLGNDKLEVIPECVEVIRFIYDSICAHKSYRAIIRACNERWGKEQKIFFYESSIYHIAQQPLYAGYQYNTNRELIKNVQITGQEIVTFDQWQQVQEIVSNKRKNYRTKEKKHWLPLSGRMYCGYCGSRLVVFLDHKDIYYCCNKRTLAEDHRICSRSRIRFADGKKGHPGLFHTIYPLLCIALMEKLHKNIAILKAKEEVTVYEAQIQNMQKQIMDTYNLISEGLATMEQLRDVLKEQKIKRDGLLRKIAEVKASSMNSETLAELEQVTLGELFRQISEQTLSQEQYAELVGLADICGTVYADRVEFHTIYGEVTIPRLQVNKCRWMPDWTITALHAGTFDENTSIIIKYKTGQSKVLARMGKLSILTE